jgi:soluble lytic murein transglycosylase-like protein
VAALTRLAAASLLLGAAPAMADPVSRWHPYTREASLRFGIPQVWVERVLAAESSGMTRLGGRPITSPAGAMGLMQLMPRTWREVRAALNLGPDPHDPRDNILAGTYYLRLMYDRFGYPGLFAAYNAGPARYAAWLEGRLDLPRETRVYSPWRTAAGSVRTPPARPKAPAAQLALQLPSPSLLFALRRDTAAAPVPAPSRPAAELFVLLGAH